MSEYYVIDFKHEEDGEDEKQILNFETVKLANRYASLVWRGLGSERVKHHVFVIIDNGDTVNCKDKATNGTMFDSEISLNVEINSEIAQIKVVEPIDGPSFNIQITQNNLDYAYKQDNVKRAIKVARDDIQSDILGKLDDTIYKHVIPKNIDAVVEDIMEHVSTGISDHYARGHVQ